MLQMRKEGSWVALTAVVSHTVLHSSFEFAVIPSVLHTLVLNSTLAVFFFVCILGQVGL